MAVPDGKKDNLGNIGEEAELSMGRSNFYRFFAAFTLRAPSTELMENIISKEGFVENLSTVFSEEAVEPLRMFLGESDVDLSSLKAEYDALFNIPVKGKYITPFESVYRTGMTHQKPMVEVFNCYTRAGFIISEEFRKTPDHIGLELDFMSHLCQGESKALIENRNEEAEEFLRSQGDFMLDHISEWVPEFCDTMVNNTDHPFYTGVAHLLKEFVDMEIEHLGIQMDKKETSSKDGEEKKDK